MNFDASNPDSTVRSPDTAVSITSMNENPRDKITKLYTDTMKEIFSPEEQAEILIVATNNYLDLQGPEDLKKKLDDAVRKKIGMKPSA